MSCQARGSGRQERCGDPPSTCIRQPRGQGTQGRSVDPRARGPDMHVDPAARGALRTRQAWRVHKPLDLPDPLGALAASSLWLQTY